MIYFIKRPIITVFFTLTVIILQAQDAFMQADKIYGPDPVLFNGKKYTYFLPSGTGGNQFLLSEDFVAGEVTIKGKNFEWASLNYDIFNQKLLLQYTNEAGAPDILEVSEAWLERFSIGEKKFILLPDGRDTRIYQVLGDGPDYILYHWRKDLRLSNSAGASRYTFSKPARTSYVMTGGELHAFSSAGALAGCFDPLHNPEIKSYIHTNKIKLRTASDEEMAELINYIGNL